MSKARRSAIRRTSKERAIRPAQRTGAVARRRRRSLAPVSGARGETGAVNRFVPRGLAVAVEPVLKVQGYADTARAAPMVRAAAEAVIAIANRIFTPEVRYRRVGVAGVAGGVLALEDGTRFHCRAFDRYLAGCREAVVFVLALGEGFDRIAQKFSASGQLLEAVLFEVAGWLAVEQATKQFVRHLGEVEGLKLTRRLAPGYRFSGAGETHEWPLTEQAELFALFAGVDLPVRLLESCAMTPKMSRSGLYGVRAPSPAAG